MTGRHNIQIIDMKAEHAALLAPQIANDDPWHRLTISESAILKMLTIKQPDQIQRAIVIDDKPVGAVVVHLNWLLGPYLRHLNVTADARGKGVGAHAIAWLLGLAQETNQRNIWLCVSGFNRDAQRFYERHGFARAAVFDDLVVSGEDEVLMRRRLDT